MRQFILFIILLSGFFTASGQKSRVQYLTTFDDKDIHFGFSLGISTLDFGISLYDKLSDNPKATDPAPWGDYVKKETQLRADVASLIPGFTVGIITNFRLTNDFDFRFLPGLSFGERILIYNYPVLSTDLYTTDDYNLSIKSTFLDFPFLIKYKARRINNDRPYIIFGGAFREDISKSAKEDLVRLKRGGFYAELGAGWDHYLHFFRLSMEAKVSIGLNNQIDDPPVEQRKYYAETIKKLTSNIFTLSFHFE